MTRKQLIAALALALGGATLVIAVATAIREFPRGVFVVALVILALAAGWYGIRRRGVARYAGVAAAVLLLAVAVVLLVARDPLLAVAIVVLFMLALAAARSAFRVHVDLPEARRPRRPVLWYNPRSGGGKAPTRSTSPAAPPSSRAARRAARSATGTSPTDRSRAGRCGHTSG